MRKGSPKGIASKINRKPHTVTEKYALKTTKRDENGDICTIDFRDTEQFFNACTEVLAIIQVGRNLTVREIVCNIETRNMQISAAWLVEILASLVSARVIIEDETNCLITKYRKLKPEEISAVENKLPPPDRFEIKPRKERSFQQ